MLQQIFIEYKHIIQQYMDTFSSNLLILCYKGKDYKNLFSSKEVEKNDKIILEYFQ